MPKMVFVEQGGARREVDAPLGLSVLEIAHKHGVGIEGACEGSLACSTCHVIVDQAWFGKLATPTEDEEDMLDLRLRPPGNQPPRLPDHHDGSGRRRPGGEAARRDAERAGVGCGPPLGPRNSVPKEGCSAAAASNCAAEWEAYTWHPFVQALSACTLPAFRRYLVQDYLFLLHFALAEALAVVKAEFVVAMREEAAALAAILDETRMHLAYCAEWGLSEAAVRAEPELAETVVATRAT